MDQIKDIIKEAVRFSRFHARIMQDLLAIELDTDEVIIEYILKRKKLGDLVYINASFQNGGKFIIEVVVEDSFGIDDDGHVVAMQYAFEGENNPEGWHECELVEEVLSNLLISYGVKTEDMNIEENFLALQMIEEDGFIVLCPFVDEN